jgi:hypothetical protein
MLDVNLINLLFMSDTVILRLSPVSDIFPWRLSKLCITLLKSCAKGLTTIKFLRIDVAPPTNSFFEALSMTTWPQESHPRDVVDDIGRPHVVR